MREKFELTALVNGEPVKLPEVRYDVGATWDVEYESCSGVLDGLGSV